MRRERTAPSIGWVPHHRMIRAEGSRAQTMRLQRNYRSRGRRNGVWTHIEPLPIHLRFSTVRAGDLFFETVGPWVCGADLYATLGHAGAAPIALRGPLWPPYTLESCLTHSLQYLYSHFT